MCESLNVENKKQNHLKPPLSVGRIACEILAGTALGLVALLVVYVTGIVLVHGVEDNSWLGIEDNSWLVGYMGLFFPPLYVLATAVSVYLLGTRGKQTGSLLLTLGGSYLGWYVALLLFVYVSAAGYMMLGIEKIVLWPLVFLTAPIIATIGFNLTRRYKEQPNLKSTPQSQ